MYMPYNTHGASAKTKLGMDNRMPLGLDSDPPSRVRERESREGRGGMTI